MASNGPYTFGFIDSLVRINFPQGNDVFVAVSAYGDIYRSVDGTTWTRVVPGGGLLSFDNGSFLLVDSGSNSDAQGKPIVKAPFVAFGVDGGGGHNQAGTQLQICSSADGITWQNRNVALPVCPDEGSIGFDSGPDEQTFAGFDPVAKVFFCNAGLTPDRQNPDVTFVYQAVSADGINWGVTQFDGKSFVNQYRVTDIVDADNPNINFALGRFGTNPSTKTKAYRAVDSNFPNVDVVDANGVITEGALNAPTYSRFINVTWGKPKGSKSNGVFVAVAGANDTQGIVAGPTVWASTDNGVTWRMVLQDFAAGLGILFGGKNNMNDVTAGKVAAK